MGRGRAKEVMEDYPIIVDELFVLKGCLPEEITVSKKKMLGAVVLPQLGLSILDSH
jgi:hypothetical protein